jgi:ClpP class serine protease
MRYAHILSRLTDSPWLITEPALSAITNLLEARLLSAAMAQTAPEKSDEREDALAVDTAAPVPVIKLRGVLGKHLSLMEMACGGCDFDLLGNLIEEAMRDPASSSVVIHVHCPGGEATGCAETFARINTIRAETGKKLYAFCDTRVCSAGYYLAAACDGMFCTPTAQLGCIGSMLTIEDRSGELAAKGIRRLTIKSASMKDIGNPDRAPTPEELSELQKRIDYLGSMFKRDMNAARPGISAEVFEKGLTYFGEQAVAVGLADAVVPSLAALIDQISARP